VDKHQIFQSFSEHYFFIKEKTLKLKKNIKDMFLLNNKKHFKSIVYNYGV